MNISHVLCPVTDDPTSMRALGTAAAIANAVGAPLQVFSGVEDRHEIGRVRSMLEFELAKVGWAGQETDLVVTVAPHPKEAMVSFAGDSGLVVMATSTRSHVFAGYLGSAAEHLVRTLHRPIVAIGPNCTTPITEVNAVAVSCDGSDLSETALPVGREWADLLDTELFAVTVVDPAFTPQQGETNYIRNRATTVDAQWEVLHGMVPARALADFANDKLLVMTTHGRSGFDKFRFGSVATSTIRHATTPVVVLNPASLIDDVATPLVAGQATG